MIELTFALVGFGNVGKALVRLLQQKQSALFEQHRLTFKITGVATGRHGIAIDPNGFDLKRLLETDDLGSLSKVKAPASVMEFIRLCPANVLFENSPVNHDTGQPAIDHLKTALECGMLAITANKGPVVHGYQELTKLADEYNSRFLFESTVLDGAPIFSLFKGSLPLVDLQGFHGILNSCTNLILGRMENGESLDEAIRYAQSAGIAETDPSEDVDGWDSAIKTAELVTVLMGFPMTPQMVDRTGIRAVTHQMIEEAAAAGERWKLVCSACRSKDSVTAVVQPERVSTDSVLYAINGTSSYVQFDTDMLPGLGIVESDPGPEATAYGLLADMINGLRQKGRIQ